MPLGKTESAMSMKRWEYKIIDSKLWYLPRAEIEEYLNRLGREGWEVVGIVGGDVIGEGGHCLAKRKIKAHHKDDHRK